QPSTLSAPTRRSTRFAGSDDRISGISTETQTPPSRRRLREPNFSLDSAELFLLEVRSRDAELVEDRFDRLHEAALRLGARGLRGFLLVLRDRGAAGVDAHRRR